MKCKFTIPGAIAILMFSCAVSSAQTLTKLKFALDWVVGGQHAPFFYTLDKGYFKDQGLDVELSPGQGPATVQQIAAGTYDMGFGDVTFVIEFKGNNPQQFDVKEVYIVHSNNPNSFLTLKKNRISDLADLKGKRIAASTFSGQRKAWPILLKKKNLPEDYITWVNYAPTLGEQAVVRGEIDAAAGYPNNAAIMMTAGAKMEDIEVLSFSSLGLDMYGNGIVANGKFINEHPDVVRKFLLAFNRGLRDSLAKPEAAVKSVLDANSTLLPEAELAKFKLIIPFIATPEVGQHGFGVMNVAKLQQQIDDMNAAYNLKAKPSVSDVYDPSFLPPANERRALSN